MAIDGSCLDVADTPANDAFFGRAGVNKGERAAFPLARVVALAECGTPTQSSTPRSGRTPPPRASWPACSWTDSSPGCWSWPTVAWPDSPCGAGPRRPGRTFCGGSITARARSPRIPSRSYTIYNGRDNAETYRLLTTITETPDQATAEELALAYAERWEIENTFDELKTHQRGPRIVLRSKSPDLVRQEIWSHLCCHHAIRVLMAETAAEGGRDPDRVSFVAALRITRPLHRPPG